MRIKPVEIEFGGQTRHLIFGHYALGELEEKAAELTDASRIKSVILTLWAGLLTETLDHRGKETTYNPLRPERLYTLSQFQVAQILDGMADAEIEVIAAKILEAQQIAKPPENPTTATPTPQA